MRARGYHSIRNTGGHKVWGCPCGQHTAPPPNHREVTAGVVASIQKTMPCLSQLIAH